MEGARFVHRRGDLGDERLAFLFAPKCFGDGADVVQAEGMVVVLVRQEHGVHAVQHEPRSLLVEVGATVDEDALALIGNDEGRGA